MDAQFRKRGLSRIELLVVILIIGVLIAVLLPVLQSSARDVPPHGLLQQYDADRPRAAKLPQHATTASQAPASWTC